VLDRFNDAFGGSSMFVRGSGAEFGPGDESGPGTTLTIADLEAIKAAVPSVTMFDPIHFVRREVFFEGASRTATVEGHAPAAERLWGRTATRGAFFTDADMESAARVALVGAVVARELFGDADPVGAQIRIGTVPFQVLGVLSPGGLDPHGVDRDDAVWIPITTMQRRVANVDYISMAKLGHADRTDLDMASLDITDVLRARHALAPGIPSDFAIYTPVAVQEMIVEANRTFTLFLPLVTLGAIAVGGFIVANLMFLGVSERRAEIGLRKALGARPGDIMLQFVGEAVMITALGGLLAVALGQLALRLAPLWSMPALTVPWNVAVLGVAISVGVGALAGLAPARRAAKLDPVASLR
jgi:putative ABC transport system permease protein